MPRYTPKRRAEAARRGWEKRHTKRNAQPLYKTVNAPDEFSIGNEELAAELPVSTNALAGGIPKWEDPVLELDPNAYIKMRRCLAVKKAVRKLAIRTQKLNWTVVGGEASNPTPEPAPALDMSPLDDLALAADPALVAAITPDGVDTPATGAPAAPASPAQTQTRAEAVAEIFGQIQGWSDFIEHCSGSLIEGTRFQQIKTVKADDPRNRSRGKWTVPDLYMGGRHRYNAGGDIEWDGGNQLVQVQSTTAQASRKTMLLPIKQFAIHRPGPGSNPEGDLDLGVAIFNSVVTPWNRGITSGDLWVRLFAIPAILAGAKIDNARPDRVTAMLQARATQAQNLFQNPGTAQGLSNNEIISLLQADPAGLSGIVAWQQYLESLADDVLTLAALTSSAGVAQANRTGDTSEQKDNEDEAAFANGVQIAETFNRHILPWIIENNPGLPPLAEDESEVYLWPNDPNEGDEQDITTETEGVEDAPELDEGDEGKPANMALIALRQIVQLGKKKDGTVRLARGDAALTPPVHNHCRCWISPDGIWYDAQDARVCTQCMVLGASYNAMSDIPQDPKEVDRLLDQKTFEEVKKAIERDSGLANRIIEQSATNLQSGVLKVAVEAIQPELVARAANMARLRAQIERLMELRKVAVGAEAAAIEAEIAEVAKAISAEAQAAPSLTVVVEREIVRARAAARAAAPIQAGRVAPGIGAAPDAIVFETTPVGKVARLVSVNVATGAGHRVIWRGGKYLLQTTGGRTIDSNADLWWLLLLLALLEKKRRDDEERKKREAEARVQPAGSPPRLS